jgi:hypothetical protein
MISAIRPGEWSISDIRSRGSQINSGVHSVPEYKIEGDGLRREARFRIVSWGTILLLLAVTVLLFALRVSGRLNANSDLRFVFAFTLLGTVVGACFVGSREALHSAERQMGFVLNDNEIVQKRKGYPDIKIAFSEIATLREELRWLIIKTAEPQRKIAVPNSVSGYDAICAELAKHHPLSARVDRVEFPLKTTALCAAAILSWTAVIWFRDVGVVIISGTGGLITLAIGSHSVWTMLHSQVRRSLLWASLGCAWLMAILVIYLRVVRL